MQRHFDLNIGKILAQWEPRHAVRELIANALDEQAISETSDIEIANIGDGAWRIRDFGRGLSYQHFQQNESGEKRKYADRVIGKFGFGLKDALATLNRQGVRIAIKSKHGEISLETRGKHSFGDVQSLHAVIDEARVLDFTGTEITLVGLAAKEMEAAKAFFLRFSADTLLEDTEYGQILARPQKGNARIYVKGLLVAEEENFLFSYNVTALTKQMEKALNRERTHVGRAAYSERIKQKLLKARSSAVAEALAGEMQKWHHNGSCDELKWDAVGRHVVRILSAQGHMLVASSESRDHLAALEDAQGDGIKLVTVPDSFLWGMERETDLNGDPILTVSRYVERQAATFKFEFVPETKLGKGEREIFEQRKAIAGLIGGLPRHVKGIEITETMRPGYENSGHTQGLWAPDLGLIIIHRGELKSLSQFAGTLLHEVVHARTGFDDVTRAFEDALTDALGIVAAKSGPPAVEKRIVAREARKAG